MGVSKTSLFSKSQNDFSEMAKVLSHPARIAILEFLLTSNSCINSDLVKELGLAQPTISQHLKELKSIGLIQGTISGTSMNYCINHKKWNQMKGSFSQWFDQFPTSQIKCC